MYMLTVVNGGNSVMIIYPRESYYSWADPEGSVRTICQSTTDVVVDAPASFCCHILMLIFQLRVVDVDVPASYY
jgi:hypothetical protein